jgi:uncharacterized protein (TIGR02301 family)
MSRPFLIGVLLSALVTSPLPGHFGLGQERDAGERQRLLDLAYTIGENHALRQACEGEADQYWRARMVRLTEVEQADQAFDAQLRERFNTGFAFAPQRISDLRRRQPQGPAAGRPQGPGPGSEAVAVDPLGPSRRTGAGFHGGRRSGALTSTSSL